jgi:hypothetical protein
MLQPLSFDPDYSKGLEVATWLQLPPGQLSSNTIWEGTDFLLKVPMGCLFTAASNEAMGPPDGPHG